MSTVEGGPAPAAGAPPGSAGPEPEEWLRTGERGTLWGIRLVFRLASLFGRGPTRAFVALLALWYAVFDVPARRGSRVWLERIHGRPARWIDVYRHVLRFVHVTLDRIFLLSGQDRYFRINRNGNQHLRAQRDTGTGAILLGAHLGSFEAMRAGATDEDFPVNIVGHFENAKMINALLTELNPEVASRVIHVGRDPIGAALELEQRLAAGEMVAILGDRTGLNDKTVTAEFLGVPARFPAGPFLLASILGCPVYLVFGLYFEPDRYELFCEPFAERIELPRRKREAALREVVQRYADRLEHYCRLAPDNWFNFFDFWASARSGAPPAPAEPGATSVTPPGGVGPDTR